jgi:hypothetical protein
MSDEMGAWRRRIAAAQSRNTERGEESPNGRAFLLLWGLLAVIVVGVLLQFLPLAISLFGSVTGNSGPVAVTTVALDPVPDAMGVAFTLADSSAQDTTMDGDVVIEMKEPDGALWTNGTTHLSPSDFGPISAGPLAGRLGYRMVVANADWPRAPRRGGLGNVVITVTPSGGNPITFSITTIFPQ